MPATNAHTTALLTYEFNATDPTLPASFQLSLHSTYPGRTGNQATGEMGYTPYARQAATRNSGAFTVSGVTVTTAAKITFPKSTAGADADAVYVGIGDAASGNGTLRRIAIFGSALGGFTADPTSDALTIPGITGVGIGDRVAFFAGPVGSLPMGITEGALYFVRGITGETITLSATSGGALLDITTSGGGSVVKASPLRVSINTEPSIDAGSQLVVVG